MSVDEFDASPRGDLFASPASAAEENDGVKEDVAAERRRADAALRDAYYKAERANFCDTASFALAVVLRRVLNSQHSAVHEAADVTAARVCRATVKLPGGAACNPTLRVGEMSVDMLAADEDERDDDTWTMPHTWIEVALDPGQVRSPNWFSRGVTEWGVDVTATQFDVRQYYASAPLAVWPAGEVVS